MGVIGCEMVMTAEAEENLKKVFKRSKRIVVVAGKIFGYIGTLF